MVEVRRHHFVRMVLLEVVLEHDQLVVFVLVELYATGKDHAATFLPLAVLNLDVCWKVEVGFRRRAVSGIYDVVML